VDLHIHTFDERMGTCRIPRRVPVWSYDYETHIAIGSPRSWMGSIRTVYEVTVSAISNKDDVRVHNYPRESQGRAFLPTVSPTIRRILHETTGGT
jgi:hypothetical protein